MPKYIAKEPIKHDGKRYAPGADIDLSRVEAEKLQRSGALEADDTGATERAVRKAAERADAERKAADKAAAQKAEAERKAERAAAEKAEAERKAAELAETDRQAAEKADAERTAAEQGEADRKAREQQAGGQGNQQA